MKSVLLVLLVFTSVQSSAELSKDLVLRNSAEVTKVALQWIDWRNADSPVRGLVGLPTLVSFSDSYQFTAFYKSKSGFCVSQLKLTPSNEAVRNLGSIEVAVIGDGTPKTFSLDVMDSKLNCKASLEELRQYGPSQNAP